MIRSLPRRSQEENRFNMLAVSIVIQAALDWRATKGREIGHIYGAMVCRTEIRQFFNSEWCEFLLSCTEIRPLELLKCMEREG